VVPLIAQLIFLSLVKTVSITRRYGDHYDTGKKVGIQKKGVNDQLGAFKRGKETRVLSLLAEEGNRDVASPVGPWEETGAIWVGGVG